MRCQFSLCAAMYNLLCENGMFDRATVTNGGNSSQRISLMENNDLCILQNISICEEIKSYRFGTSKAKKVITATKH